MSRSNPTVNTPSPCKRWLEFNGETGDLRYYDKQEKKNIVVHAKGFTFLLLDQLAVVKGWHEASESNIQSNEVRDTRVEPMLVKAFKGGKIAEGLYADIRDRVAAFGGHFVTNCYIGFRDARNGPLQLGSIQFKGAALNSWVEFTKANRKEVYEQAVMITGSVDGKKGSVKFKTPTFTLVAVSPDTDVEAKALDIELQEYLKGYFDRTRLAAIEHMAVGETPQETPDYDAESEPTNFRTKPASREAAKPAEATTSDGYDDPTVPF